MAEIVPLHSLDDTCALAIKLARELKRGDVVALSGELGTGKTTFAQFLVWTMSNADVEVTSPTFTLLQTYPVTLADGTPCLLHHYDLYRIEHARELEELGFEEAFAGLTLIEWPQRLADPHAVTLALSFRLAEDGAREVHVQRIPS